MTARTQPLPGMEEEVPEEVADAAKALGDCRRKWMKLGEKQIELSAAMIEKMREHKVKRYVDHDEGFEYTRVPGDEKIKMKRVKEEEEGAEE